MALTLQGLIGQICLAYLDDVIVFSKRRSEHFPDLRVVFKRIRDANLKLKPKTCSLLCDQVLYLGHVIDFAGVSPDSAKLKVLAQWPIPKTLRKMQSFLKFVNFYGDFFIGATQLTSELYELTASK